MPFSQLHGLYNDLKKSGALGQWLRLFSSMIFSQAVTLLFYPLITRLYAPAEMGLLSLFVSLVTVIASVACARYENAIIVPAEDEDAFTLAHLSFVILLGVSVLIFVLTLVAGHSIALWLKAGNLRPWFPFIALSVFFTGVYQIVTALNVRFKYFSSNAGYNLHQSTVNTGLKILAGYLRQGTGGLVVATLVSQVTSGLSLMLGFVKKQPRILALRSYASLHRIACQFISFPAYQVIHTLTNTLSGQLPLLLLTTFFGAEKTGLYALAFGLSFRPIQVIAGATSQILSQRMASRISHGISVKQEFFSALQMLTFLGSIPFLLAGALARWLFPLVFGQEWTEAGIYFQYLLPWLFMVFLSSPFAFIPAVFMKQRKALMIEITYCVARILAMATGVLLHNIYVALALFSATGVFFLGYALYWYKQLIVNFDTRRQ